MDYTVRFRFQEIVLLLVSLSTSQSEPVGQRKAEPPDRTHRQESRRLKPLPLQLDIAHLLLISTSIIAPDSDQPAPANPGPGRSPSLLTAHDRPQKKRTLVDSLCSRSSKLAYADPWNSTSHGFVLKEDGTFH